MDKLSHARLRRELRQHIEDLLTVLDELGRGIEGLSPAVRTQLQGAMVDLQARLHAFYDLVESSLMGAEVDAESQDALARLIDQIHARQQDVEDQLQRLRNAPTEEWEARMTTLETAWGQLDKAARVAMQELAPRPRPDEA